ncbi:MAG: Cas8a1 family CRISPR/Cas system-associated protein, partial [Bacillota bacterium]|nr:Cas8a1 family CRISPR/Cas system-associated protein [Bacillota bacterium]
SDSNKDIKSLLKKEFTDLFCQYLTESNGKRKDSCICCDAPMSAKEKSSIAFVKDVADDLGRKRSAFWNCNVDAYICPVCNFLYALAPLGFMKIGPDMVFINDNSSLRQLLQMNRQKDFQKENENRSWSVLYNEILGRELLQTTKRIGNLQVVIRRKEQDRYDLNIIGKDVLSVAYKAKTSLDNLTKWSAIRLSDGYLNVYTEALDNLLHHRNQYLLIDRLFRMSIDTPNLIYCITSLLHLQDQQTHHRIQTQGGNEMGKNDTLFAAQAGAKFRENLVKERRVRERITGSDKDSADASLRGLTLQLLNDLRNRDQHSFLNRLYRIYAATSQEIPKIFGQMTQNDDAFLDLGYHFIRGLKGGYFEKKQEEEVKDEK